MQQLMSYLLWWRGTPRPLTGQDRTNWRMHSDGATLSQLLAQLLGHRWVLTAPARRAAAATAAPLHGSTSARVQCRIKLQRPLLLPATYVLAQLRRATAYCATAAATNAATAAPPSFAHQMICQLSNVAFHILTELLFECEHPVILLISSVLLCWSIQEL